MKTTFSHIGLAKLCGWFGITRQAYYNHSWKAFEVVNQHHIIIDRVKEIRANHPRLGTRKLFDMLQPFFNEHKIKMGRDALFNLLYINHLLVRKHKRKISTTNSYHRFRKYPTLIKAFINNRGFKNAPKNTFYNIVYISKISPHISEIINIYWVSCNYGFCKNESWGFYNYVIKKFDLSGQEINIINDEGHVTLENLFDIKKSKDNTSNYLILTNYQSENNNDIFNSQYEFLKNYKILYRKNNCYLLKSND